jgi:hypothetical protein
MPGGHQAGSHHRAFDGRSVRLLNGTFTVGSPGTKKAKARCRGQPHSIRLCGSKIFVGAAILSLAGLPGVEKDLQGNC